LDVAVDAHPRCPAPDIRVRLRSQCLWAEGVRAGVAAARRIADELFDLTAWDERTGEVYDEPWVERVSRIDLAVDWQPGPGGWLPNLERDLDRFVTRAIKRRADVAAVLHKKRERLTGLSFGKTPLMVRIYDRVEELRVSEKTWMRELWERTAARAGLAFDAYGPVWRLEAQLSRPVLRELRVDGQALDDADSVLAALSAIWGYVTGDWLRLAVPQADSNRSRWPTDPCWQALRTAPNFGGGGHLERERIRQGTIDHYVRMLLPLLAHAAALAAPEVVEDPVRAVLVLDHDITRELDRRGVTFRDLVARHRPTTAAAGPQQSPQPNKEA